MGRSYGCTISEGGAAPEPARVRIDSGQLLIEGSRSRRIDLIDVEVIAREDVLIGVRVCPGEMIVFQKLGRDFEIFYDEIGSERRRRMLSGLFLLDRNPTKCFPCRFSVDAGELEADLEIYPASVLFYPNGAAPFHIPLSYIARQGFDPERWAVELELCEGSRILVSRLGKLTREIQTLLEIALKNHAARAARLRAIAWPDLSLQPGLPLALAPTSRAPLERPFIIRRDEALYLAERGATWLCVDELSSGLHDAQDSLSIPPDEALLQNTVLYQMTAVEQNLVIEVLNQPDYATYVFRSGDPLPLYPALRFENRFVMHITRALDSINFRREPVYETEAVLQEKHGVGIVAIERLNPSVAVLRRAFAGRVVHAGWSRWREEIEALTTDRHPR